MHNQKADIVVVGGGPAGLMAAGQAAQQGSHVVLLEKMRTCGRKLSITGKGRCNLTNTAELTEFIDHFGRNGRFLRQVLHGFFSAELIEFFKAQGIDLVVERGGRVFPEGARAPDVTAALLQWATGAGVQVRTGVTVQTISVSSDRVAGVKDKEGNSIAARAVILATGGASYPGTGSTGDGYKLAQSVGHKVSDVRPALVPLETGGSDASRLAGLELRNAGVRLYIDGKKRREEFGELAFTDFGISGPTVLTLSGDAVDALRDRRRVEVAIDLKPALDVQKLDARLLRDLAARGKEPISSILRGLLPLELVGICIEETGLPAEQPGCHVMAKQRHRIRNWLKEYRLNITGHRSFKEAIITAGGIELRGVDPHTMQSRLLPGLFFAGELLDLHGDTGGYNLQAAFSTGWLAGRSAVESLSSHPELTRDE